MSQDLDLVLDGGAWEGEDLSTKVTIGVRSAEDMDIFVGAVLNELDHQTTDALLAEAPTQARTDTAGATRDDNNFIPQLHAQAA